MPTASNGFTVGTGPVTSGPVVTGGSTVSAPLVQGEHQPGNPFRTSWDAVSPPGGGGTEHYVHTQTLAQSVVTIEHELGFRPAGVALFSLDYGTKYRGYGVQHLDVNRLRVSMDVPTPFVAVLS